MPNVFPGKWYNDDAYSTSESGYVLDYNRLVGGLLIVQGRGSKSNKCVQPYYNSTFRYMYLEKKSWSHVAKFPISFGTMYICVCVRALATFEYSNVALFPYFFLTEWYILTSVSSSVAKQHSNAPPCLATWPASKPPEQQLRLVIFFAAENAEYIFRRTKQHHIASCISTT
jgi:hypothetical protein